MESAAAIERDRLKWLQQLFNHLYSHVAAILPHVPCSELHRTAVQTLRDRCRDLPINYDLLTVKLLKEKFTTSFHSSLCAQPSSSTAAGEGVQACKSCRLSRLQGLHCSGLLEVPGLLVGRLGCAGKHGVLCLEDETGSIPCEVCYYNVPLHVVGRVVLLCSWSYIHCKPTSYLEIQDLHALDNGCHTLPTQPEPGVQQQIKRKRAPILRHVRGRVTAVSEIQRNGKDNYLLMVQVTEVHGAVTTVVIDALKLLHLSTLLHINHEYHFTDMKRMVLNKGLSTERSVLASSSSTAVFPLALGTSPEASLSPPAKRPKSDTTASETATESNPASQCSGMEEEASRGSGEEWCTQVSVPPSTAHLQCPLVSYKGTVTRCVAPELGVFELDGRLRLYLTYLHCLSLCRGIRCGAVLELHNVHIIRRTEPWMKNASGLCCCSLSSVRVAQFSMQDTEFKAFKRGKLAQFMQSYQMMDVSWIVEMYCSLLSKYKSNSNFYIAVLEYICQRSSVTPVQGTAHVDFIDQPHDCHVSLQPASDTVRPEVAELSRFTDSLPDLVLLKVDRLGWISHGKDSCADLVTSSAQWSFGVVKSSSLTTPQVLVGKLRGGSQTGHLELTDSTGSLPLVCCSRSRSCGFLQSLGSHVVTDDFSVIAERTQEGRGSDLHCYVHVRDWKVVPADSNRPVKEDRSPAPSQDVVEKTHSKSLSFFVLNKNALVTGPGPRTQSCSFSVQALVHSDLTSLVSDLQQYPSDDGSESLRKSLRVALVFAGSSSKWYCYLNNGCFYTLTPADSMTSLKADPCIEIREETVIKCEDVPVVESVIVPPIMDVADVLSNIMLPKLNTAFETFLESRATKELVSFKGVILQRAYRIDHEALASGELPQSSSSSSSPALSTITVLTVQSLKYPDSIAVYYQLKDRRLLPLGLLPGSVVTFHSFKLRSSKSGNVYSANCALSSIELNSVEGALAHGAHDVSLRADPWDLKCSYLGDLMSRLLHGRLSGRTVHLMGSVVSVQRTSVTFTCRGCQSTVVDGHCRAACLQRSHSMKVEGRFIVDDGTAEGHVYASGAVVPVLMGVSSSEWAGLLSLVEKVGQVVYNRNTASKAAGGSVSPALSLAERAQFMLDGWAAGVAVPGRISLLCQPFVSAGELRECVIGAKSHMFRLGPLVEYSTLSLPRLQLRAISVSPVNYCRQSERLLTKLGTQ